MLALGTINNEHNLSSINSDVTDTFTSNANEDEEKYKTQFNDKINSSITVISTKKVLFFLILLTCIGIIPVIT